MNFYNLGDQSFEADFKSFEERGVIKILRLVQLYANLFDQYVSYWAQQCPTNLKHWAAVVDFIRKLTPHGFLSGALRPGSNSKIENYAFSTTVALS